MVLRHDTPVVCRKPTSRLKQRMGAPKSSTFGWCRNEMWEMRFTAADDSNNPGNLGY